MYLGIVNRASPQVEFRFVKIALAFRSIVNCALQFTTLYIAGCQTLLVNDRVTQRDSSLDLVGSVYILCKDVSTGHPLSQTDT